MKHFTIAPKPAEQCGNTLAATLQALLAHAGSKADIDAINVALGGIRILCQKMDGPNNTVWYPSVDEDGVEPAADLFGIELRHLHPPRAARGVLERPEYQLHFQDSYEPLIGRALDVGQPVIAWYGWPGPNRWAWGLISETAPTELGLAGSVAGQAGVVALVSAPAQCYVVEKIAPCVPELRAVLTQAMQTWSAESPAAMLNDWIAATGASTDALAVAGDLVRSHESVSRFLSMAADHVPDWPIAALSGAHGAMGQALQAWTAAPDSEESTKRIEIEGANLAAATARLCRKAAARTS